MTTETDTELAAKVSELGQGQTYSAILRAKATKDVRAVVMDYILATLEHERLAYEWTEGPSVPPSDDTVEDDTARAAQLEAAMSAKATAWVALCETFGVHP